MIVQENTKLSPHLNKMMFILFRKVLQELFFASQVQCGSQQDYNHQNHNATFSKQMYYFPCPPFILIPSFSYPSPSQTFQRINEGFHSETNPFSPPAVDQASLLPSPSPPSQLTLEPLRSQRNQTQRSSKSKMIFQDGEYRPDAHSSKKKSSMKQIENRNIIPNLIRLILSFIQKKGKSEVLIEKLFKKLEGPQGSSPKRFYLYQSMIKNLLSNYVNEETLRFLVQEHHEFIDVYGQEEQRFYNRITRILISHFIKEDSYSYLMTSKRMNREKKYLHVNALRIVLGKMKTIFNSQSSF